MNTEKKLKFELKVSLFAMALALLYLIAVKTGIEWNGVLLPGIALAPTLYPNIVSALFLVTAGIMLIESLYAFIKFKKGNLSKDIKKEVKESANKGFPLKEFLPILLAFVLYLVLLPVLGFILDTILLSFFCLFYVNKEKVVRNIVFSFIFSILVYLLFAKVLKIFLPTGFLAFI